MRKVKHPQRLHFDPPPAPDPTPEERLAQRVRRYTDRKERAQRALDDWKSRFEKSPAYAFEWASNAYEHAAWLEVTSSLLAGIQSLAQPAEEIERVIKEQIVREGSYCARQVESSTSRTSNLMKDHIRVVWAKLADEGGFW